MEEEAQYLANLAEKVYYNPRFRNPTLTAANVPGCFASGDCTGSPFQIAKLLGEGNIAAHSAFSYLAKTEKKEKET